MSITIRPAQVDDSQTILDFIQGLADYEKASECVLATVSDIEKCLFSEGATAHGLICEQDGKPVGFSVYFFNYSTWLGKNGLYLEDLFVDPSARGLGAGKVLLQHLARIAVAKDCGRFEWMCLDWNQPAIDFYESLGAEMQPEWKLFRLTGDKLLAFAEQNKI